MTRGTFYLLQSARAVATRRADGGGGNPWPSGEEKIPEVSEARTVVGYSERRRGGRVGS